MDQTIRRPEDFISRRLRERSADRRRAKLTLLICCSTLLLLIASMITLIWSIRNYPISVRTQIHNEAHQILVAEVQQTIRSEIHNELSGDLNRVVVQLIAQGVPELSVHQWRSDVFESGSAVACELRKEGPGKQSQTPCDDWLYSKAAAPEQPSPIDILKNSSSRAVFILVGSHDATGLRKAEPESIRTNPELAGHRADAVRDEIVRALKRYHLPLPQFIMLTRPPAVGNRPVSSDRTVAVTLIDQAGLR